MVFRRIRGRIVPIKQKEDQNQGAKVAAGSAAVGAGAGASYYGVQEYLGNKRDLAVRNSVKVADFKKRLKPGDILVMGSSPKHSGGVEVGAIIDAVPNWAKKPAKKLAKKVGLKADDVLLSNSSLLTSLGAGKKYHSGVYVGNGKVVHMSTDYGAVREALGDAIKGQNVSALRFKNANARDIGSAIKFANDSVKKRVQYQGFSEYAMNAVSSVILPIKKAPKRCFDKAVCHTLPIRSYAGKKFGFKSEYTFSGQFRNLDNIETVARRDVVKSVGTTFKSYSGSMARGLKWAVPAAALGYAAYKLNQMRKKK